MPQLAEMILRISFFLILTPHSDNSLLSTFFVILTSLLLGTELAASFGTLPQAFLSEEQFIGESKKSEELKTYYKVSSSFERTLEFCCLSENIQLGYSQMSS